jgi:hypothetical protein
MSAIIEDKNHRTELEVRVKAYVLERTEEPVYVRNLMDEFGNTPDEKDLIRSLVWAMISRKDLKLGDGLSLRTGS